VVTRVKSHGWHYPPADYPVGNAEIALGSSTLTQAGFHVGSRVRVSVVTTTGITMSQVFKVVGVVTLPTAYSNGGLGTGAFLPFRDAESVVCPVGPKLKVCDKKLFESDLGMECGGRGCS
jgi:hypothetical protein